MDETGTESNIFLLFGGLFSLAFAIFQVGRIFLSHDVAAYFGGPAELQAENPVLFTLLCLTIRIIIAIAGFYALSGTGKFRCLPLHLYS